MKFQDIFPGFEKIGRAKVKPPKVIALIGPPGSLKSAIAHSIMREYLISKEGDEKLGVYTTFEEDEASHRKNIQSNEEGSFGLKCPDTLIYADIAELSTEARSLWNVVEKGQEIIDKNPDASEKRLEELLDIPEIPDDIFNQLIDEELTAREVVESLKGESSKRKVRVLLKTPIEPRKEYAGLTISPRTILRHVPEQADYLRRLIEKERKEMKQDYIDGMLKFMDSAEKEMQVGILAIDSVTALRTYMNLEMGDFRSELAHLLNVLKKKNIYILLLTEGPVKVEEDTEISETVAFLSDIVIRLTYIAEEKARYMQIQKWRGGGKHSRGLFMIEYMPGDKKFEIGEEL